MSNSIEGQKRIFLTGATGLIGRAVVEKLKGQNVSVVALSRKAAQTTGIKDFSYILGDINNPNSYKEQLKVFRPEIAIHLAWEGIPDYGVENSVKNIVSSLALYKCLADTGCKKIVTSGTFWEYGLGKKVSKEKDVPNPSLPLAVAKNGLRLFGQYFSKQNEINFVWTRLSYVYGPGQREGALIPYLITNSLNGTRADVQFPKAKNDYLFSEDVGRALVLLALSKNNHPVYNIGSGKLVGVSEIIECIKKHISLEVNLNFDQVSNAHNYGVVNIDRIREETGWEPLIEMESGIIKLIKHLKNE